MCNSVFHLISDGKEIPANFTFGTLIVEKSGQYSAYFGLKDYPEVRSSQFEFLVNEPYIPIKFTEFEDEVTLKPNDVTQT